MRPDRKGRKGPHLNAITGGRTWLLGLVILPMLGGFLLLDAGVGMIMGAATAAALIVVAARSADDGPIEIAEPGPGVGTGVVVLALAPIEEVGTAGAVARIAERVRERGLGEDVLVVAPARSRLLDRWADDLERARFESQRVLAVSLATMAAAGIRAEGRVGDGELVRAVEDTLRSYAAREVVVITRTGARERSVLELERRLPIRLHRVEG